ncbi:hypothetical protein Ocin01_09995 [Orchesella cincta]|uniref:Uncharacterized protein n=1 Tax=Orchesella cincta TaxID=48709 RepID=A0A1D2MV43_ORCCI|nr:hypothetical protein Ocin01_09995 [Orchesella cincta]
MCCIICLSVRGAAYFGTSAQILLGLALTIRELALLWSMPPWDRIEADSYVLYLAIILMMYGMLILCFGCWIFRAMEKRSLRLLKVSVGGFTILQCLIVLTHVSLLVIAYDVLKEDEKVSQLIMLILNFVLSSLHLSILFLYIIRYPRMAILTTMGASDTSESNLTVSVNSGGGLKKGGGVGYHRQSLSSHGSSVRSTATIRECAPGQRYVDGEWENLHC